MRLPIMQNEMAAQDSRVRRMVDGAAAGLRVVVRSLVERADSDSDSKSKGDTPASLARTQNMAIALGVIIPVGGAIIVLIFLHRKHLKKQRAEDMNDPHKSLDFGMEGIDPQASSRSRKAKKGPEMIVTDVGGATARPSRRGHGMSFDLGVDSPYLLPAGLQSSKESIHSMSRNYDEHDPYRPVTMMRPSTDTDRYPHHNNGSVYSLSTNSNSLMAHDRAALTANARPMSITPSNRSGRISSQPPTPGSLSPRDSHSPISRARSPLGRPLSMDEKTALEKEVEVLPSPPAVPEPVALMDLPPRKSSTLAIPPRAESLPQSNRPRSSVYGEDDFRASIMPDVVVDEPYDVDPSSIYADYTVDEPEEHSDGLALHAPQPQRLSVMAAGSRLSIVDAQRLSVAGGNRLSIMGAGNRLSVMGARPLPPDMPEDNPEVRANRIRSFYKEYFDDSKTLPVDAYYEDEYNNDLLDGVYYDPESGGYFAPGGPSHAMPYSMPYAQPPGRRAMTPPPRQKPRVSGPNSPMQYPGQHFRKFSSHSTMSGGRPTNFGARGRPMVPAKKLPAPLPLLSLPTPHKLGQDVWISNPIDFAPPSSVRTVQNGARPDSPFGVQRPYSPSVRAFTPLASSFDVLSVLPSPHDLRRSGTFTALDFAPPSRIRDPAMGGSRAGSRAGSDAGSIRSTRSGISAVQHHAVQKGAYRVSRIPKEMVTSRDDLSNMLRPKMDMVSRA